ncbi:hypothetical protein PB01_09865 [Psychrobacillus glaciei]|uniref:DUF2178 domain-containing protein n=1 Tax=Psychrobacillus glaciei TaxID=2283160 RepID=A0A5J6SN50_9BACI|nr:DUF2208 family protein [Psychrobacillus glaciei]QFF99112.1 hypothetical protein PB01_09865 [Psychrobacillus glaciei]
MKNLLITIVLRILLIISFAIFAFVLVKNAQLSDMFLKREISFEYYMENEVNTGLYNVVALFFATLNSWYTHYQSKKRNNGRIIMKEIVIPEMIHDDERESEITGKSAKAAFSIMFVFSFILMASFSLVPYALNNPLSYAVFAIASLPIVGFIAYFIVSKVLYSR